MFHPACAKAAPSTSKIATGCTTPPCQTETGSTRNKPCRRANLPMATPTRSRAHHHLWTYSGCMPRSSRISPAQAKRAERAARGEPPVYDSYARLSKDPRTGEVEKIDTQLGDNRDLIARLGGQVGVELSDGISAWRRDAVRKGWRKLLDRAESGESDGIAVWHSDRLFRLPADLVKLLELSERGIKLASARGVRDLANPDDVFILHIEVAHAERSSEDTSRRLRRKFEVMRATGRLTGGIRRFGFPGMVPVPKDEADALEAEGLPRAVVSAEQVAAEREGIAWACQLVVNRQGEGVFARIAREWNERGLRTPWGNVWTWEAVPETLSRAVNAGLIEYDDVMVGRFESEEDVIVSEDLLTQVRSVIKSRRRGRSSGQVGRKYVGTGIVRCGGCGRGMSAKATTPQRGPIYFCPKHRGGCGRVSASLARVDQSLRELVIARLSDREHMATVRQFVTRNTTRLRELTTDIDSAERTQEALSERLGHGELSLAAFDKANRPLVARLAALTAERDALREKVGAPAAGEVGAGAVSSGEVAAEWDALNAEGGVEGMRVMLRRALGGTHAVVIAKAASTGRRWDPARVRLVPLSAVPTAHHTTRAGA
ncbi:MAG: recombinase family protein [Actinophytocola sp.]|uniref:recombinase family protein n=1 Tax=Actinophytocola sp. TaxID=1872138 RepID=UPI003C74C687